jgi:hypothetical protein
MIRAILAVRSVAGVLWLVQLVLGVLFWTGHALGLVNVHMGLGFVFVLALWTLAFLCARAGAPRSLVAWLAVVGAVIPVLGMTQMQILPGPQHWIVRVVHLLVGIAAMPLAGRLSMAVLPRRTPRATPTLPDLPTAERSAR